MKRKIANKVFDEMIEQAVKEYVEEQPEENYEKVEFSDDHKGKMNTLFEEVARREEQRKRDYTMLKVAAIFIFAVITISLLSPQISAWRERILKFFMKDKQDYSWVAYGDERDLEELVDDSNKDEYDISFLGYVPEGFKVNKYEVTPKTLYVRLRKDDKEIIFRISNITNRALDTEETETVHEIINGMDTLFILKDNDKRYIWNVNDSIYDLSGNISKEDLVKIIENIDYEKIEKILK